MTTSNKLIKYGLPTKSCMPVLDKIDEIKIIFKTIILFI